MLNITGLVTFYKSSEVIFPYGYPSLTIGWI